MRKRWYLVAYDISDPKSLVKIHRLLKRHGVSAQKSVFFVFGSEPDIIRLLKKTDEILHRRRVDIRAYPIMSPDRVWSNRANPLADYPVLFL